MLRLGYSVDQVVHEYGDVCQAVTKLAIEQDVAVSTDEFRTLDRCLDNAIADAVASHGNTRQSSILGMTRAMNEQLAAFADEQHRLVDIAIQSYAAIKAGNIGATGATRALLTHTLAELRSLPVRTFAAIGVKEMKNDMGIAVLTPEQGELVSRQSRRRKAGRRTEVRIS